MLSKVYSGAVHGVNAHPIEIEVNAGHGDPQLVTVGLPDVAIKESKDRVHTALVNSGVRPHLGRTTINLTPADIKNGGPCFDLPIAIGMLAAQGDIEHEALERVSLIGSLALSGEIRRVRGVLPIVLAAREQGQCGPLVPAENAEEAGVVEGLNVYPIQSLREAADCLSGKYAISPCRADTTSTFSSFKSHEDDYADVKGQEQAKLAIEIAVAVGDNGLMIGPPGMG